MKNEQLKVTPVATIQTRIFNIRGVHVMIDKDLSNLYGVETKVLNQAVKRNIERFPEDFMFQLTKEECSRSQIVTLNIKQGENIKYLPYAFTELGIAMLSGILRSPIAIQVNINILRAFVEMRKQMKVLTENTLQIENLRLELQNQKQLSIHLISQAFQRIIQAILLMQVRIMQSSLKIQIHIH